MNSKESSIRVVTISGPAPMTYESGLQRRAGMKAPSTQTLGGLGRGGKLQRGKQVGLLNGK